MKVCEYCGSECEENERVCPSCGGDAFKAKCHNCGTVFTSLACPNCGVKAGDSGKICPECSTRYFSPACPNCGYTPLRQNNTAYNPPQTAVSGSGCNIIWWILGWIFLFPIPLTILMVRNRSLNNWLKICIIVISWVAFFLLAIFGLSESEEEDTAQVSSDYISSYLQEISE